MTGSRVVFPVAAGWQCTSLAANSLLGHSGQRTINAVYSATGEKHKSPKHAMEGWLASHFGRRPQPLREGDLCKVHGLKGPMGSIARLWGVYRGSH